MVNDRVTWKCVIVRKSPLNQNLSSVLLLDFCVHHGLSLFKHKGTYLAIWLYPRLQCDDRLCSCIFELVAAGLRHLVQDRGRPVKRSAPGGVLALIAEVGVGARPGPTS